MECDVLGIQEAMVSGAGLDSDLKYYLDKSLDRSDLSYQLYSSAGIVQSLSLGIQDLDFPPAVARIFSYIISTQLFLLKVPLISYVVASAPRALETMRERIGTLTGIDIWSAYYVTLAPYFGISTLVKPTYRSSASEELVLMPPGMGLGIRKHLGTTQRVLVRDGETDAPLFWFVNVHYIADTNDEGVRIRSLEAQRVVEWMKSVENVTNGRVVIVGDHNTLMQNEGLFEVMRSGGYKSALLEANGEEPNSTWPTGIQAVYKDVDGAELHPKGVCLDYIWIKGMAVKLAGVAGDKHKEGDETLFASDHIAIWADLVLDVKE